MARRPRCRSGSARRRAGRASCRRGAAPSGPRSLTRLQPTGQATRQAAQPRPAAGWVVRQAVLPSPMFAARWRWNLNTSLAVLRMRGGKKNPPAIQRMEADDLMAAVFPTLAACQENVAPGPLEIPDQVLVRQTMTDCLHEAMHIAALQHLPPATPSAQPTVPP